MQALMYRSPAPSMHASASAKFVPMRLVMILAALLCHVAAAQNNTAQSTLVLQTDFGVRDHAVAAMRGVARFVAPDLQIDDLTHEIPAYNIWQAAYRLNAVTQFWPAKTVFVSVVDPGVGSDRESVVAQLATGQLVVTPNNGTLTLLHDGIGIVAVRRIDEDKYRLPGSSESHTFHGRDLYVHVGALLANARLQFDDVGELTETVLMDYEAPTIDPGGAAGGVPVLDPQFGNIWTNIPAHDAKLALGTSYEVRIFSPAGRSKYKSVVPFVRTFSDVPKASPLLYVNSIGNVAVALNQGDFAKRFGVSSGPGWRVTIRRVIE